MTARRRLSDQGAGDQVPTVIACGDTAAVQYYTLQPERGQRQGRHTRQQLTDASPDLLTNQAGSREAPAAVGKPSPGAAFANAATAGSVLEGGFSDPLQALDSATSMHSVLAAAAASGARCLPRRAVSELAPSRRMPAGACVPLRQHELGSIRMAGLATGACLQFAEHQLLV